MTRGQWMQHKHSQTAVFLKSRLEIYLSHTNLPSQKLTAPGILNKLGHSRRQTQSNAPSSSQAPHYSNGNHSAVALKQKVKKNSVSFDSHTAFNCSEGLDQIGTISEQLMPMEKIATDSGSETLFSITLNDTVYTEHVQDGEELRSDRKFMCSPLSYFWGLQ